MNPVNLENIFRTMITRNYKLKEIIVILLLIAITVTCVACVIEKDKQINEQGSENIDTEKVSNMLFDITKGQYNENYFILNRHK